MTNKHDEWIEWRRTPCVKIGAVNTANQLGVLEEFSGIRTEEAREYLASLHTYDPEVVTIQWGAPEYKEIVVTDKNGTQGVYWPEDAIYPLLKTMIGNGDNDK